jgi:hypothetical protein
MPWTSSEGAPLLEPAIARNGIAADGRSLKELCNRDTGTAAGVVWCEPAHAAVRTVRTRREFLRIDRKGAAA